MKALVTGGAGFIGSHLVEKLVQMGIDTIVYDNLSTGNMANLSSIRSDFKFVHADVRDLDSLISATKKVDWVFHLAALTSVNQSIIDPLLVADINIKGTQNVLWASLKSEVSRVVFSSSCAVYGDAHKSPLKEIYLPNPKSPYAASKLAAEAWAESFYYAYGLETISLRYFNVYGQRQSSNSDYAAVIPRFLQFYQEKNHPQIYGDGLQSRDFVYVADVAEANLLAANINSDLLRYNRVFNIGFGRSFNLLELLNSISQLLKYHLEPQFLPPRVGEVRHSCADISLAKDFLRFSPVVDMEIGINNLLVK